MSRPFETSPAVSNFLHTLEIEKIEENLFRGVSPQAGWQRVFGGQVIAQALVAATQTVVADRFVHSLHSYFLRPGDPSVPILYQVERLRDGASFSTRRVVAIQHGQPIFAMSASYQRDEPGYDHHAPMPGDIPPPETLPDDKAMKEFFLAEAPAGVSRYWGRERPVEIRPTSLKHYLSSEKLEPRQNVWVRMTGPVPNDRRLRAAMLAYVSDMTLLDTSLYAHGTSIFDPALQVASLDHSMWFHRPIDFDGWLLYAQDSPSASGARGLNRGGLYGPDGRLIASVAQEGLIRKRADA